MARSCLRSKPACSKSELLGFFNALSDPDLVYFCIVVCINQIGGESMKYSLLLLLITVVACQQPTSTAVDDLDLRLSRSSALATTNSAMTDVSGIVTWTNKPGHAGKITTASGSVYTYNVNAGHTVNGYRPVVGDAVLFNTGTGLSARFVRLDDSSDDDGDGGGGDGDGDGDGGGDEEEPDPVCLPGQFLGPDKICYWIPS